jgi:bilirubin oxidase
MPDRMMGMQGSTILVNGVVTPTLKAKSTLLRLRLHNGSNARTYRLAFSDARLFHIIASDCGFLPRPFQTNEVRLAAAERVEILVDVSDKKQIMLKSLATSGGGMMPMMRMMNSSPEMNIMLIDASQAKQSPRKIPIELRNNTLALNPKSAVTRRKFDLQMGMMGGGMGMMGNMAGAGNSGTSMFQINSKSMDIKRIDFQTKRNTTEIWEIGNSSPMAHPFHVHNVQFRILDRNGKRPHPSESGLKDVVLVQSNEKVRIIMKFPEYSDSQTPYMYHCHILEHEDQGMMGQFVVV